MTFQKTAATLIQGSHTLERKYYMSRKILKKVKKDKEYILKMLGIEINASRLKCAMLGLKVIKLGIYNYLGKKLNQ